MPTRAKAFDPYSNSSDDPAGSSVLPLPNRYRSGMYPNWQSQLAYWAAQVQPIKPEEAREGRDNAIVAICLHWIATSWQVAKPVIGTMNGKDFEPMPQQNHPFLMALLDSDVGDSYIDLVWRCLADWVRKGNVYLYKIKSNGGETIGYEWIPARFVRPIPHPDSGRLWYYAYSPYGGTVAGVYAVAPEDMVHIKHGAQEDFPLLGVSPIAAQFREIVTDNGYSDYSGGLARNGGMPQLMFTPKLLRTEDGDQIVDLDADTAREMSDDLNEKLMAEPGRMRIIPGALEMHKMGIEPDKMALSDVRAVAECRIPAALGLPVALLQLYTGLAKSTMNNMDQSIKQGWRGCMIPLLSIFADALTKQALRDWSDAKGGRLMLRFDTSDVPELKEDQTATRQEARNDFVAGLRTLDEARAELGVITDDKTRTELQARNAEPDGDEGEEPDGDEQSDQGDSGKGKPGKNRAQSGKKSEGGTMSRKDVSSLSGQIYTVAGRFRKALRDNENGAIDALLEHYLSASESVTSRLDEVLAEVAEIEARGGGVPEATVHVRQRLIDIKLQIDKEIRSLSRLGSSVITDGQSAVIDTTLSHLESLTRAAVGPAPKGVDFAWNHVPKATFENLLGMAGNGSPLSDVLLDAGGDWKDALVEALTTGVAEGLNPKTVAARMATITNGSRARMENIARTEMLRASREASRETYKANSDVVTGYVRLAANDMRTCPACWALSGQEQDTDEVMAIHPSCRCVCLPRTKSWADITGDSSLPDTRPIIPSGADAFEQLTDDEKREVLGPGRFAQYQAGKPLSDMVEVYNDPDWGPSVRVKPIGNDGGDEA